MSLKTRIALAFAALFAVLYAGMSIVAFLLLKRVLDPVELTLAAWVFVFTSVPTVLLMFLFGIFLCGRALSPVKKIAEKVSRINRDSLSERIPLTNVRDEIFELSAQLNTMLNNLSEAFGAQDRFVSDASHELRTPIAVIDGYAQLLRRWGSKDPAVSEEAVDAISKEADRMSVLIDNMLYLSRTERSVLNIKKESFFLDDLLDEVVRDSAVYSGREFVRGKMEPTTISADRELIRQLIRIVVDNAVKYSQEPAPITISCYTDAEGNPTAVVEDRGAGIAPENLVHLFERFFRTDKVRTPGDNGSGLGLAIAKKIADKHNAEIVIESALGEGTTVRLRFEPETEGA